MSIPDTVAQKQLTAAIQFETNAEQVSQYMDLQEWTTAMAAFPSAVGHCLHCAGTTEVQELKKVLALQIFESQAQLIRKETDGLVNAINNNATIISQNATSQANLIAKTTEVICFPYKHLTQRLRIVAPVRPARDQVHVIPRHDHEPCDVQAMALALVSGARNTGLQALYRALNVTDARQKAQVDYILSLTRIQNLSMHVGYQTKLLTSGPKL